MFRCSCALLVFITLASVCGQVHSQNPSSSMTVISTEAAMVDTNGKVIRNCLEPHIMKFGDTWYAYGFVVRKKPVFNTTCYSSSDLKRWTYRNTFTNGVHGITIWNVLYNTKNKEYIGFGAEYGSQIHVYTSKSPVGPFKYHNKMSNVHGGNGDMLLYPDSDGKAYLIYNKFRGKIPQRFAYVYQLNEDYYDIIPSTLCNTNKVMEGFWMLKRNGTYFLFGSGLVSYDVDDNFYLTAPTPLGPWKDRGYFAPVGTKTFSSQTFQGLEVSGPKGNAYVFIGHRWKNKAKGVWPNATSIWLPLKFNADNSVSQMKWYDKWILDTDGATYGLDCSPRKLFAQLKLDEGKKNQVHDTSSYKQIGLFSGKPSWQSGRMGKALHFAEKNNRVVFNEEHCQPVADNFTLAFWAKPTATKARTSQSNSGVTGTTAQRYAFFPANGDEIFGHGHAGAGVSIGTNGIAIFEHASHYLPSLLVYDTQITDWTHFAVVYDHKRPKLYMNGTLIKTGELSTKIVHPSLTMGGSEYGWYQGGVDEVNLFSVALSNSEIALLAKGEDVPEEIFITFSNPFKANNKITFNILEEGTGSLSIYDLSGKFIKELVKGKMKPGLSSVVWDGTDVNSNPVASDQFICKLSVAGRVLTKRLVLYK